MSTDSGRAFFDEFIDDYFAECEEHLGSARALMLQLETPTPSNRQKDALLDELLRNFHSIKGLSAMVGMEEVTQLSHHIEDYFRELKEPQAQMTGDGISQVLAAVAKIEQVLNARRKSERLPDVSAMLLQLTTAAEEVRVKPRAKSKPETAAAAPAGQSKWRFEFKPSSELAANGVTVSTIRDRLSSLGQVLSASPLVSSDGAIAFEFTLLTSEPESRIQEFRSAGVTCTKVAQEAAELSHGEAPVSKAPAPASNLVRVEMSRLDELMRIVGELVMSRFHLDETLRATDHSLSPAGLGTLQEINTVMERQIRDLRQTVIRTRMVPIGQIFERMRFVARGLERESRKKVQVEIAGQDTELDKVIVEKMMDPLLHLVRNSISHGIELPDQRIAAGKPAEGSIRLSATTAGDTVLVEVQDDGRGIDVEKVKDQARSLGLLKPGEILDSKRLLDVICSPGFTTRSGADLTSGRGVGMAAVMSTVTELGGSINLQTAQGKGTRFAIELPLTLAISDSMLVNVEKQRFAIPQASIREVFAIETSDITVFENNEVVPYRGGVLPILRLARYFGIKTKARKRLHILVVGTGPDAIGLTVDRVAGQREIVVRSITDPFLRIPGVAGATELGDGRPVLILDVHTMMRAQRGRAATENRS
jgi:two-component system chemotaxis sensor kinase CheA